MDQQQTPQPPPPQWSPPPQQQAGWAPSGYATAPSRPGGVTFAGIFLIVMGVIGLLAAALLFMGTAILGGAAGDLGEFGGVFAGFAAFAAILSLVWGLANLLGGIGSLQGKSWGRATGIVIAVIAVIFGVIGLLGSLGAGIDASSLVINLVVVAAYVATAWALIQAGAYFAYRR